MRSSDAFRRRGNDVSSRFWSTYERVATQHDDEFLDRHNSDLDVLLIFVGVTFVSLVSTQRAYPRTFQSGLFSAVSAAFIVNMESNLSPNASDTTNALLKVLINKVDNGTFSDQEASLPVWTGPSFTNIWIQTLVYTSLSTSLLAAFGAVLGKQWLGHFKTSRFGQGTLDERCKRRQQKLDGLEAWHFSTIVATLPIFLQLSLLFFGIALAANIWNLQHTVASVIMATTAFGLMFYFFTVITSLKTPDSPFQTPVSIILQRVLQFLLTTAMVRKWRARPKPWRMSLSSMQRSLWNTSRAGKYWIRRSIAGIAACLSRILSTLMQNIRLRASDLESARGSEHTMSLDVLHMHIPSLVSPAELAGPCAIQWIIETSTDTDIITAAVWMVSEVEWPDEYNVTFLLGRLTSHFYACFDSTRQLLPLARERAVACLKAIFHFRVERDMEHSLAIFYDGIVSQESGLLYEVPIDQGFLLILSAVDDPNELDITSLASSDRMWLAHMLTYRLHDGSEHSKFLTFVIDFIDKCLHDPKSPAPRLVADCLLLAGQMIGLQTDRKHLARLDKRYGLFYCDVSDAFIIF
jgi:Family of unknown function (DUF6535)